MTKARILNSDRHRTNQLDRSPGGNPGTRREGGGRRIWQRILDGRNGLVRTPKTVASLHFLQVVWNMFLPSHRACVVQRSLTLILPLTTVFSSFEFRCNTPTIRKSQPFKITFRTLIRFVTYLAALRRTQVETL